jgi:hypothetical protein
VRAVARAGGAALLDLEPGHVDVLGLDYYAHSEWSYSSAGAIAPSPSPRGLAALIGEYGARYDRRLMLTETNIRGTSADRATWLRHTLAECEVAVAAGAPLEGYCWFPFVDSVDWDSLLRRHDRHIDPVGVYWLDERLERHASSMSRAYAAAAGGTPACELPAYRFSDQVKEYITPLLRGWPTSPGRNLHGGRRDDDVRDRTGAAPSERADRHARRHHGRATLPCASSATVDWLPGPLSMRLLQALTASVSPAPQRRPWGRWGRRGQSCSVAWRAWSVCGGRPAPSWAGARRGPSEEGM